MHAIAVGNGVGLVIPPSVGDQVTVTPKEGDSDNYVISGRLFHDDAPPPTSPISGKPIASGEVGIFGPGGSFMHLTGDGIWHWKGDMVVDGNLKVTKQITDLDGKRGTLNELRQDYDDHKHPGVQPGGGTTGKTDKPTP